MNPASSNNAKNIRLDQLLVERGLMPSRSRARDSILRGCVKVDGAVAAKHGQQVSQDAQITVEDPTSKYVSRSALKLVAGLEATGFDVTGKHCLDLGASTGGFSQVLLEAGAAHVTAIDVGHGQMVPQISNDPRVTNLEEINARELTLETLSGNRPSMIVCDVSFISLKLALPPTLELAADNACGIFLVKPQFEVGRENIGKGGLVRGAEIGLTAAQAVRDWFAEQDGWQATHFVASPIAGGDGNREYLLGGQKCK